MSARTRSIISRCGRRRVLLLARCLTALVILDGVVLVFSGSVLAQEPDTPIDAGIERSKPEPFLKALHDVETLEREVKFLTQEIGEAELVLRAAEQGLRETSLETARSKLDEKRRKLEDDRKALEKARDKLEEERQKLPPDYRVDLAILNLAAHLRWGGWLLDSFLAQGRVYRTREEAFSSHQLYAVTLDRLEDDVACWLAVAHLGPALRDGGASPDALQRWEEARAKAWKIMTARVEEIRKKLEQAGLFQKGYHFMHTVYHRALAKGDHEQRAAGLAGGDPLIIKFTGPCPGAGCPEEERQKGQTR